MMIAVLPNAASTPDARLQTSAGRASDASGRDPGSAPDPAGKTFAEAMAGIDSRRESDGRSGPPAEPPQPPAKAEDVGVAAPRMPSGRILALAPPVAPALTIPPRQLLAAAAVSGARQSLPSVEKDRLGEAQRRSSGGAGDPADVQALVAAAAMLGGMSVPAAKVTEAPLEGAPAPAAAAPTPQVAEAMQTDPRVPARPTAAERAPLPAAVPLVADTAPNVISASSGPMIPAVALGVSGVSTETALPVVPAPATRAAMRGTVATALGAAPESARGPTPQVFGRQSSAQGREGADRETDEAPVRAEAAKSTARDTEGLAAVGTGWAPDAGQTRDVASGESAANPIAAAAPAAPDPQPQPVRSVSFDIDGTGSDPVRVRMRIRGDSLGLDLRGDSENLRRVSTDDLRQSLERAGYAVDSIKLTASAPAPSNPSDSGTHAGDQQQQRQHHPQANTGGAGEPDAGGFGTSDGAGQGRAFAGQRDSGRRTESAGTAQTRAEARGSVGSTRRDVIV